MSWQFACGIVLGLVLLGGFAWYERSKPSSRIVALVAAMAVLAVAGRVAFAPIPNVVATTDIVLITGLVLGAAPGFACGALAALVSNFWLGQGAWTPWQMAAWGLVGVAGALLARIASHDPPRIVLAGACALAAFGFGAIMDLSLMTSFGGEQSLNRFLALTATSLPFTIAHAVGNFVMAMVAGPALVRMLLRLRDRFEFEWAAVAPPLPAVPRAGAGLPVTLIALAATASVLFASAAAPPKVEAASAAEASRYLQRVQNSDGGFGVDPQSDSSPSTTGWAALGLAAVGINPLDVERKGRSPIDFLRKNVGEVSGTGDLERSILALAAAGVDARDFGGRDLVGDLLARRRSNGSWEGQVNLTAFGILALRAAGQDSSTLGESASWLRSLQARDGGWGINKGAATEPDSTGAALQALAVAPGRRSALDVGVGFLRKVQRSDGGFELTRGAGSNSQSTAWALQGAIAAGAGASSLTKGGSSGISYLAARQKSDGHITYSRSSDQTPVWVTAQAMVPAAGEAYPISRVPRKPSRSSGSGGGNSSGGGSSGGVGKGNAGGTQRGKRNRGGGRKASAGRPAKKKSKPSERLVGDPGIDLLTADEVAAAGGEDDEEGLPTGLLLGGLGALAAGLGAGFVWYRRRPFRLYR